MLCAETPTRLATAFIDRPRPYSSIACRFTSTGLPRGVVRVNCRPQPGPLHFQRCRPQAWPDLISTVPRQAGQASGRSFITPPPFSLANASNGASVTTVKPSVRDPVQPVQGQSHL